MAQQAFDVIRNGRIIDTVFATGYDAKEMYRSLVNHDGYPADIVVLKCADGSRKYTEQYPEYTA